MNVTSDYVHSPRKLLEEIMAEIEKQKLTRFPLFIDLHSIPDYHQLKRPYEPYYRLCELVVFPLKKKYRWRWLQKLLERPTFSMVLGIAPLRYGRLMYFYFGRSVSAKIEEVARRKIEAFAAEKNLELIEDEDC